MHRSEYKYFEKTGKLILPVFLFLMLVVSSVSIAQKHEFGLGVGGLNYIGDVNPRYNFSNYRPGGMAFYRFNGKNSFTALRLGFSIGKLAGSEHRSKEAVADVRDASFTTTISEISLMGEYNFFNFRNKKQLMKFSPYLTGGLAVFAGGFPSVVSNAVSESSANTGINVAVPFGLGMKFILTKNLNLGTEFIAHKTFTDYLDGVSDGYIGTKSTGNPLDNDWYFYTGVSLSYTIYKVKCPQESLQ